MFIIVFISIILFGTFKETKCQQFIRSVNFKLPKGLCNQTMDFSTDEALVALRKPFFNFAEYFNSF